MKLPVSNRIQVRSMISKHSPYCCFGILRKIILMLIFDCCTIHFSSMQISPHNNLSSHLYSIYKFKGPSNDQYIYIINISGFWTRYYYACKEILRYYMYIVPFANACQYVAAWICSQFRTVILKWLTYVYFSER